MSPLRPLRPARPAAAALATQLATTIGSQFRDERRRRSWTILEVADRARVSTGTVVSVEAGRRVSLDVYARLAVALGTPFDMTLGTTRQRAARERSDLVHAAMGELEARLLMGHHYRLSIDHPYQHYQFAGRADVLAWTADPAALLHIENRTRFPELHEAAGSFNAKCQYLATALAKQVGLAKFASQTHVMAGLWSSEILRVLRVHEATFSALCPDGDGRLAAWFEGNPPQRGFSRSFILLDPFASDRQPSTLGLADAIEGVRPRVRGYREAAERLRSTGRV